MTFTIFRKAVAVSVILLSSIFVFAQQTSDAGSAGSTENLNQTQLSQSQIEEKQFTLNLDEDASSADQIIQRPRPVSTFWIFARMIIVLGIVIGVIYFIFRLLKKSVEPGVDTDPFLRKVASLNLMPGKSVQIVTLIDKAYLLGVSEDSVNLISEIDDKELINAMNLHCDKTSKLPKAKNFEEVLQMFMGHQKKAGENEGSAKSGGLFDASTENLINSIKNRKMAGGEKNEE